MTWGVVAIIQEGGEWKGMVLVAGGVNSSTEAANMEIDARLVLGRLGESYIGVHALAGGFSSEAEAEEWLRKAHDGHS